MTELKIPDFPSWKFADKETGQVIVADLSDLSEEDWDAGVREPVKFALPFIPFIYLGFFNPEFMGSIISSGFVMPTLAVLAYGLGLGREFSMRQRFSRNLNEALGKAPSKEAITTILKTQKSLEEGQNIFIPLSELENYKPDIEIPWRVAQLGVDVNKYTAKLVWKVTKSPEALWDEAIEDLIEVYSLRVTAPEKPVMKQLGIKTIPAQEGNNKRVSRFKKFMSENRFISIQKID